MAQPIRTVHITSDFEKAFRKLPPHIKRLAVKKDLSFRQNAFNASLRTHKLKGPLEGYCAYSINHSCRVLFRFAKSDEVLYLDIGTHEIYR